MAKVDLKNAFRLCPVRPVDWHLLGIHWRDRFYVDKCLPFILRSAPFLFNMVADALQWILEHYFDVSHLFHYLDDFFFAGQRGTSESLQALNYMLTLCQAVQAPLKPEKVFSPATLMVIPGIELDTISMQARLPVVKLVALLDELQSFATLHSTDRACTKRQLLSLMVSWLLHVRSSLPVGSSSGDS